MANSREPGSEREDLFHFGGVDHCCTARELPADQLHGQLRAQDHTGRFWIYPEVVFGCRRHVAFATGCSAHDHAAAHVVRQLRPLPKRQGQVGQWSQGDDLYAWIGFHRAHDGVYGKARRGGARSRFIAVIAESVAPVEPDSIFEWAGQRCGCSDEDGNGGTAKLTV